MAHAYTPGLKVSERTVIRKRRMLPIAGEVRVRLGDRVRPRDVVARAELPGNVQLVNIAHHLGIEPSDVPAKMKVEVGERVRKGQIIAENVGLFGWFRSHVEAPCDGEIEALSKVTGQLLIRENPIPLELTAYVGGEVVEVIENEGVEIATVGAMIQGILGVGGEKHGRIAICVKSPDQELQPEDIPSDAEGLVLVGGAVASLAAYRRASECGATGLVVGSFSDPDLGEILGYDLGIAITGGENLTTTLIITEGFGRLAMAERTFQLLRKLEGNEASINGATQIRAGVIRPEIIVSTEESPEDVKEIVQTETRVGTRVRIIREPHFGEIARIKALPPDPVVIESGATVRVMVVELPNGTEHVVPRANVELIEE
ncbi:MAG: hypothetical protein N2644_10960 [Candidatus Sumerlaea chitinivorans]|uniref:RnfC Barrel sandwich hybrid domain-containing protein n=1 Tax=Sumerlaea chitinivorans TaxID=2250252 RepID=A0A2Z4Y8H8_SUMC1|nr:hypothetical protein BRCON_2799 [Candidatus Sumerlaea chitinivorans]MCX7964977.1 hypothetical protein [Candidatus Sumerlaea chitinivorans]